MSRKMPEVKEVTNAETFVKAMIELADMMRFPGVDTIEPHVPEDEGAEVAMVYLDNGKRFLVTVAPLPDEETV